VSCCLQVHVPNSQCFRFAVRRYPHSVFTDFTIGGVFRAENAFHVYESGVDGMAVCRVKHSTTEIDYDALMAGMSLAKCMGQPFLLFEHPGGHYSIQPLPKTPELPAKCESKAEADCGSAAKARRTRELPSLVDLMPVKTLFVEEQPQADDVLTLCASDEQLETSYGSGCVSALATGTCDSDVDMEYDIGCDHSSSHKSGGSALQDAVGSQADDNASGQDAVGSQADDNASGHSSSHGSDSVDSLLRFLLEDATTAAVAPDSPSQAIPVSLVRDSQLPYELQHETPTQLRDELEALVKHGVENPTDAELCAMLGGGKVCMDISPDAPVVGQEAWDNRKELGYYPYPMRY
jgi:hypothetical protein